MKKEFSRTRAGKATAALLMLATLLVPTAGSVALADTASTTASTTQPVVTPVTPTPVVPVRPIVIYQGTSGGTSGGGSSGGSSIGSSLMSFLSPLLGIAGALLPSLLKGFGGTSGSGTSGTNSKTGTNSNSTCTTCNSQTTQTTQTQTQTTTGAGGNQTILDPSKPNSGLQSIIGNNPLPTNADGSTPPKGTGVTTNGTDVFYTYGGKTYIDNEGTLSPVSSSVTGNVGQVAQTNQAPAVIYSQDGTAMYPRSISGDTTVYASCNFPEQCGHTVVFNNTTGVTTPNSASPYNKVTSSENLYTDSSRTQLLAKDGYPQIAQPSTDTTGDQTKNPTIENSAPFTAEQLAAQNAKYATDQTAYNSQAQINGFDREIPVPEGNLSGTDRLYAHDYVDAAGNHQTFYNGCSQADGKCLSDAENFLLATKNEDGSTLLSPIKFQSSDPEAEFKSMQDSKQSLTSELYDPKTGQPTDYFYNIERNPTDNSSNDTPVQKPAGLYDGGTDGYPGTLTQGDIGAVSLPESVTTNQQAQLAGYADLADYNAANSITPTSFDLNTDVALNPVLDSGIPPEFQPLPTDYTQPAFPPSLVYSPDSPALAVNDVINADYGTGTGGTFGTNSGMLFSSPDLTLAPSTPNFSGFGFADNGGTGLFTTPNYDLGGLSTASGANTDTTSYDANNADYSYLNSDGTYVPYADQANLYPTFTDTGLNVIDTSGTASTFGTPGSMWNVDYTNGALGGQTLDSTAPFDYNALIDSGYYNTNTPDYLLNYGDTTSLPYQYTPDTTYTDPTFDPTANNGGWDTGSVDTSPIDTGVTCDADGNCY